jgi:hypothetical protein
MKCKNPLMQPHGRSLPSGAAFVGILPRAANLPTYAACGSGILLGRKEVSFVSESSLDKLVIFECPTGRFLCWNPGQLATAKHNQ